MVAIEMVHGHVGPELRDELAGLLEGGFLEDGAAADAKESRQGWLNRMGWWWDHNPFLAPDDPLLALLRTPEGELVGVQAFVPAGVVRSGERVPALTVSVIYVMPDHRSHSLRLLRLLRDIGRSYRLADAPTPELGALMERFGFTRVGSVRWQSAVVRGRSIVGRLLAAVLVRRGAGADLAGALPEGHAWIRSVDDVGAVPSPDDGNVRPSATPEALRWLASVGHEERHFVGVVNAAGDLAAYAFVRMKTTARQTIIDVLHAEGLSSSISVSDLVAAIAADPVACGLPRAHRITWPVFDGTEPPTPGSGASETYAVFVSMPDGAEVSSSDAWTSEGDAFFV